MNISISVGDGKYWTSRNYVPRESVDPVVRQEISCKRYYDGTVASRRCAERRSRKFIWKRLSWTMDRYVNLYKNYGLAYTYIGICIHVLKSHWKIFIRLAIYYTYVNICVLSFSLEIIYIRILKVYRSIYRSPCAFFSTSAFIQAIIYDTRNNDIRYGYYSAYYISKYNMERSEHITAPIKFSRVKFSNIKLFHGAESLFEFSHKAAVAGRTQSLFRECAMYTQEAGRNFITGVRRTRSRRSLRTVLDRPWTRIHLASRETPLGGGGEEGEG